VVGPEMGISFDKEARGVLHQEGQTRTVQTRTVKNDAARGSHTDRQQRRGQCASIPGRSCLQILHDEEGEESRAEEDRSGRRL
jgi:hypothetical protein